MNVQNEIIYLDSLAQAYLTERKMEGASEQWLGEMQTLLNKRILANLPYKPADQISYLDIIKMAAVAFPNVSLQTRQRYFGYLKACFNFGKRNGLVKHNPFDAWKKQKEPKYKVRLNIIDLEKLIQHAADHIKWTIKVEWELGTRPGISELFKLQWKMVDYERLQIHIPGTKTIDSNRIIPITKQFSMQLKEKQKISLCSHIIDYKGKPIKSVQTGFNTAQKRAKIPYRVRLYDIRHLFVSVLLAGGADLAAVSRIIGHSSVMTTQQFYYHVLPGEMERAIAIKPTLRQ